MKKFWGILLTAVLIISLAGCGKIGFNKPGGGTAVSPGGSPQTSQTLSAPSNPGEEQIAETVLYDQGGIKITALSLDVELYGLEYPEMEIKIENNTSSDIKVSPNFCSINNYRASAYLTDSDPIKVRSSRTTNIEFYFREGAAEAGTDYVVYIDLNFDVYDPDTYETITWIGPLHIETTAAQIATPTYDDSGAVVVDNSDIKIVLDDLIEEEDGSQYQECFVYNKRNSPIEIQSNDVTVNGKAVDPYFYSTCDGGKYDMNWIYFYASDLEEAGIDDITELGLSLVVLDADTYDTIYESGPLVVTYD